jgi:hypothetical protein
MRQNSRPATAVTEDFASLRSTKGQANADHASLLGWPASMNAFAFTRTHLPLTCTPDRLTPRVVATSKVLPDFDAVGFHSLSEMMNLPFLISTFM